MEFSEFWGFWRREKNQWFFDLKKNSRSSRYSLENVFGRNQACSYLTINFRKSVKVHRNGTFSNISNFHSLMLRTITIFLQSNKLMLVENFWLKVRYKKRSLRLWVNMNLNIKTKQKEQQLLETSGCQEFYADKKQILIHKLETKDWDFIRRNHDGSYKKN